MSIDWNKVAAIGTCFGAIATFLASFISLHIANKSVKKKIKIKAFDKRAIINGNDDKVYVSIDITNIGIRQVIVSGVGYKCKHKSSFAFMNPSYTASGDITPFKRNQINPEENFFYLLERTKLIEYIKSEKVKEKDVKFFCMDTTGNYYFCKLPNTLANEIWT